MKNKEVFSAADKKEIRYIIPINKIKNKKFDTIDLLFGNRKALILIGFVILIVVVVLERNWQEVVLSGIISLGLGIIINEAIIKKELIFNRKRPYISFSKIKAKGFRFKDSSFPSTHMTLVAGVASVLVHFYFWIFPVALGFTALVGIARIHAGMHYPSDVFAGFAIGVMSGIFGIFFAGSLF